VPSIALAHPRATLAVGSKARKLDYDVALLNKPDVKRRR
jgi:hypothetical protein